MRRRSKGIKGRLSVRFARRASRFRVRTRSDRHRPCAATPGSSMQRPGPYRFFVIARALTFVGTGNTSNRCRVALQGQGLASRTGLSRAEKEIAICLTVPPRVENPAPRAQRRWFCWAPYSSVSPLARVCRATRAGRCSIATGRRERVRKSLCADRGSNSLRRAPSWLSAKAWSRAIHQKTEPASQAPARNRREVD